MTDDVIGALRTVVQAVAGAIATWLLTEYGINVSSEVITLILFAVLTFGYRQVITVIGRRWPKAEVLNGWPKKPEYGPA